MYSDVLSALLAFLMMALTALTAQNAVFSRSLGISRLVSLIDDTTDTLVFGILLTLVMSLSAALNYFLTKLVAGFAYIEYLRPLFMVLCMAAAFFAVLFLSAKVTPQKYLKKAVEALPAATFNCLVLGTLLLSVTQKYDFAKTMGFSVGSSIGFIIAVLLVTEAQRKLQNRQIPAAFKGLPATLLYLAALALAIYGVTGFALQLG